jgi:RNA polymerase sigma-70 factor, ECF subfamily
MRRESPSDDELIARYRNELSRTRSERHVDELFRRYQAKVASWCLAFTNDRESAADLGQEICAKAFQNLSSFRGQSKFSTWLFSIARNHCLNAVKARSRVPTVEAVEMMMDELPDLTSENPDAALARKEMAEIARQLVTESLEETERVVFTLHFAEELPLDTITRMLNLTNRSGAKAFLVSAKRKLQQAVRVWKAKA